MKVADAGLLFLEKWTAFYAISKCLLLLEVPGFTTIEETYPIPLLFGEPKCPQFHIGLITRVGTTDF